MAKQTNTKDSYGQIKQSIPRRLPIVHLPPIYKEKIQTNYPVLIQKDLQVAEIYRSAEKDSPVAAGKNLNPLQVKIGRKGTVWVDVILERKKGVKIKDLERVMRVRGKPGRSRFVSGRVKVDQLPRLNKMAVRMQTARPIATTLNQAVPAISADRNTLDQAEPGGLDGTGVIVGVVDFGCDFTHQNFIKNGNSRILYLWDQNGSGRGDFPRPENYDYGVEYDQPLLNQALHQIAKTPCEFLQYPLKDDAHGTHVMDIAAGNSPAPAENFKGVAPGADIIFVDLRDPSKTQNADDQLKTLGSSIDLYNAVKYIFEKAAELGKAANKVIPVVVNLSLASSGGAHDGTSLLETWFDEQLKKPGNAIVIAAGNDYRHKLHTFGTVSANKKKKIAWHIPAAGTGAVQELRQEMEIWYPANSALKIEVFDPNNDPVLECHFNESKMSDDGDTPICTVYNAASDPTLAIGKNHIDILVNNHDPNFQDGDWLLKLSHDELQPANNQGIKFQAWIENIQQTDDPDEDSLCMFPQGSKKESTINGIGNAALPIVVGACNYDLNLANPFSVPAFTSAGPSLNPLFPDKPELNAPGVMISSARATTSVRRDKNGTSFSAPFVTGVIALLLQKNKTLTAQEIRAALITSAVGKKSANGQPKHDPQLGFGRVNAVGALSKII